MHLAFHLKRKKNVCADLPLQGTLVVHAASDPIGPTTLRWGWCAFTLYLGEEG